MKISAIVFYFTAGHCGGLNLVKKKKKETCRTVDIQLLSEFQTKKPFRSNRYGYIVV